MAIDEPSRSLWRVLWQSELSALASLLVCAAGAGLYGLIEGQRVSKILSVSLLSPLDTARFSFLYALVFGVVPVMVYGAPIYAVAKFLRFLSWKIVVLIGLLPGVVLLLVSDPGLGLWFIVLGLPIAMLTHFFYENFVGKLIT